MTQLELLILAELERHEEVVGPFFNLRCKCGFVGKTVSETGDFERHLTAALAAALDSAGLALADEVLDEAALAAQDPTPEDMDRYFIDQSDAGGWLRARAAAARSRVHGGR